MQVIHIVLVGWSTETSAEERERAGTLARAFRESIPGIAALEEGPSVSPEGLEAGHDWGLVITFDDEAARDAYLVDPVHAVLAQLIGARSRQVTVFDLATG